MRNCPACGGYLEGDWCPACVCYVEGDWCPACGSYLEGDLCAACIEAAMDQVTVESVGEMLEGLLERTDKA